ncbi:MAG TPA: PTS sugar transporter subunit IIA [Dokdonella sp.]|uniref:PTS sugar transporter subunit IIA n=1 Tax=Dokdonella sp. TaxID=2291710 RepID=UPI0025C3546B|nr:PTS sugar transporter subunit IIA [Dokdonella sp.]MBX3692988.1 PTS sugar transporter subunit IIA [Dokdonella sp.]MCW5566716.1 PTS sugar transporter subunit IIA [Dokdonella sp.]HNR91891.1 PTS sugar transporter subunit IIA [Dokdonella sp.]
MPFLDLLPPPRIRTDLVVTGKPALIESLADLLAVTGDERPAIRESLLAREQLGSTGLGRGVAIPHGRVAALDQPRAAFIRLASPLDFEAIDGHPVDLVAALVVPTHYTDGHLHLLAELAEMFSNSELTTRLRTAPDAPALRDELAEFKRRQAEIEPWTD